MVLSYKTQVIVEQLEHRLRRRPQGSIRRLTTYKSFRGQIVLSDEVQAGSLSSGYNLEVPAETGNVSREQLSKLPLACVKPSVDVGPPVLDIEIHVKIGPYSTSVFIRWCMPR